MLLFNIEKVLSEDTPMNTKTTVISQEELAKQLGVARQTISSLENGRYNPSILLAHKISKYFGMTIEEVFIFEEE